MTEFPEQPFDPGLQAPDGAYTASLTREINGLMSILVSLSLNSPL
jgi:hypothetical protein